MQAEATEDACETKKETPGAGQNEDEETSGLKPAEASRGRFSWRGEMLENVVKADDVEHCGVGKVLRKEPGCHRQPVLSRLPCDPRVGLQARGEIAATSCRLQEPPVRAADVQQASRRRRPEFLESVQDALEVEMPEVVEGHSATGLVDGVVTTLASDGRCQRRGEEAA